MDQASAEARIDAISENAKLKEELKWVKLELEIIKNAPQAPRAFL